MPDPRVSLAEELLQAPVARNGAGVRIKYFILFVSACCTVFFLCLASQVSQRPRSSAVLTAQFSQRPRPRHSSHRDLPFPAQFSQYTSHRDLSLPAQFSERPRPRQVLRPIAVASASSDTLQKEPSVSPAVVEQQPALKKVTAADVTAMEFDPVDPKAKEQAADILADLRSSGWDALLSQAVRLGDIKTKEDKVQYTREELKAAFDELDSATKGVLQRSADRIRSFAMAQRDSLKDLTVKIPGGEAGHFVEPVHTAGCYAPGGRYPLPSSVLMTALTARAAGVKTVWVASPRPQPATLAAAYLADADGLLAVGGAQAIGAMAYGVGMPHCDVIVGPGNKWVTAAKSIVSGLVAIDMLAGPSEVLIIADSTADVSVVAADLLAQAEHDPEARPILVCTSESLVDAVNSEVRAQLAVLPTAKTAAESVKKGFACVVNSVDEAIVVSDAIRPEHLEIQTEDAMGVAKRCSHYGAVFVGQNTAEVFGDYGAGPNHVLPTGGTARYTGGLSVFTFLRIRSWINMEDRAASQIVVKDAVALARVEGLEGHARAAEHRLLDPPTKHEKS